MGKPGDQGFTVQRLELIEFGAIHDPRDHFAHIIRFANIRVHDAVKLIGRIQWITGRPGLDLNFLGPVQIGDDLSHNRQRVGVIKRQMIGNPAGTCVHIRAAQLLCRYDLAGRGFHQGRPSEEDRSLFFDDHRLVGHRRHIGTARRAGSHHRGDLRNTLRRHGRLIVENSPEMLPVREHIILLGQVRAAGIHQIDARHVVLPGDLLGAQMLLHGDRKIGAALNRGIVDHDHTFAPGDPAHPGQDSARRDIVVIHLPARELREFQEG